VIKLLNTIYFEGPIIPDGRGGYMTTEAAAVAGIKTSITGKKRPIPNDSSDSDNDDDDSGAYSASAAAAAGGTSKKNKRVRTLNDLIQNTDDDEGWVDSDGEPSPRKKRQQVSHSALKKVSDRRKLQQQQAAASASGAASSGTSGTKGKGKGKAKARAIPPTATAPSKKSSKSSSNGSGSGSGSGSGAAVKVKAEPRTKQAATPVDLPWPYESEVAKHDMVHKAIWIKWNGTINAWYVY
jgi:hypothetical protein